MKSNFIRFCQVLVVAILSGSAYAQPNIAYANTLTPQQLVEDILLGQGVSASNIMYNGSPVTATTLQTTARSYTATNFPFSAGVYLRTGGSSYNVASDPDLNSIANGTPTNGSILEFDFVATGDSLNFNYIFASVEYTSFTCSGFNDAFGFFLSGPGIVGSQNLALVPGGNVPVTINTVNSGTPSGAYPASNCAALDPNWQQNSQYFTLANNPYSGEGYNGGTTGLIAKATLICGETYHIKLCICNVADTGLDSGVYLEAGSFTTFPVGFNFNSFTLDNAIYEGCNQLGTLMFTREGCGDLNQPLVAYLTYGGAAVNGTDYLGSDGLPLGDSIYFAPGEDTLFWQIIPFEDFLDEGLEDAVITIMCILTNGDTVYSTGTFFINDVPELFAVGNDVLIQCYTDSTEITASANGGFAPYSYEWDNGDLDSTTNVFIPGNGVTDYYVTVTDACGYEDTDTVTVTMNQTLAIDSIMMLTPASCLPEGSLVTTSFPFGAIPANPGNPGSIDLTFDWTYEGDTNFVFPDQSSLNNLYGGWYYLELTDNVIGCTVYDSVFIETINTPQAVASLSPGFGCSPTDVVLSNSSNNSTTYTWNFGNGNTATVTNQNDITQTYYSDGNIMLVASNGIPACNDTTFLFVDIVVCGCTDPTALNYDPNAVIDAGNCTYPVPTVVAPNVITANGDNINAFFFLQTEHAAYIKLTILNRWGNVMFEGEGDQLNQPMWFGTNLKGDPAEDGVYFYRYLVRGPQGDEVEGHGFVEVVR